MAVGLEPPKKLFCHGHWTIDDKKISKSTGNVISPFSVHTEFTTDGLRYFLLREAVPHSNASKAKYMQYSVYYVFKHIYVHSFKDASVLVFTDYTSRKIRYILNAELANNFGNLLSRCLSRSVNPQRIISNTVNYKGFLKSNEAITNIELLEEIGDKTKQFYEEGQFRNVVDSVMNLLRATNVMFSHHQPWMLRRSSSKIIELEAVILLSLESVRVATLVLHPIIPKLTTVLLDSLQIPLDKRTWEDTKPLHVTDSFNGMMTRVIAPNLHLFKRLSTGV